jgi:hypothetical protein
MVTVMADAGAPVDEIEVTPRMIEAGIAFMEAEALNTVSTRVMTPDFIKAFYRASAEAEDRP